jgi:hypothetical protein
VSNNNRQNFDIKLMLRYGPVFGLAVKGTCIKSYPNYYIDGELSFEPAFKPQHPREQFELDQFWHGAEERHQKMVLAIARFSAIFNFLCGGPGF